MSGASIALHRFGLGARADEPAPAQPRRWLLDQLDRFDPRPPPIAALPGSGAAAAQLAQYLGEVRTLRRDARRQPVTVSVPAADEAPIAGQSRDAAMEARRYARRAGQRFYAGGVAVRVTAALTTPAPFVCTNLECAQAWAGAIRRPARRRRARCWTLGRRRKRFVFAIQRGAADGLGTIGAVGDPAFAAAREVLAEDFATGGRGSTRPSRCTRRWRMPRRCTARGRRGSRMWSPPLSRRSHSDGENVLETRGAGAYQVMTGG